MRRPSRWSEILMVRFPRRSVEIEAKINCKGCKRLYFREKKNQRETNCFGEKFVAKRRREEGEAEEDKLLCVIYGAAGLRFIYLYCSMPPRKQSKLLPQCQNSLLLPVFCAESLYYMQIYKWLDLIGAGGLPGCVSRNVNLNLRWNAAWLDAKSFF